MGFLSMNPNELWIQIFGSFDSMENITESDGTNQNKVN